MAPEGQGEAPPADGALPPSSRGAGLDQGDRQPPIMAQLGGENGNAGSPPAHSVGGSPTVAGQSAAKRPPEKSAPEPPSAPQKAKSVSEGKKHDAAPLASPADGSLPSSGKVVVPTPSALRRQGGPPPVAASPPAPASEDDLPPFPEVNDVAAPAKSRTSGARPTAAMAAPAKPPPAAATTSPIVSQPPGPRAASRRPPTEVRRSRRPHPDAESRKPIWPWILLGSVIVAAGAAIGVYAAMSGRTEQPPQAKRPDSPDKKTPAGENAKNKGSAPQQPAKGPLSAMERARLGRAAYPTRLEDVNLAIVKLEMPTRRGQSRGAGFFIDHRGWIATNYHVIREAAGPIIARMYGGRTYRVESIIAAAPERDLAILKIDRPPHLPFVLDISYEGNPSLETDVYANGHPDDADFSYTRGSISRVLTTSKLNSRMRQFVNGFNSPADHTWIQHDAAIYKGNSGGPLIEKKTKRVLGVNTWVNTNAELGYATHVRYLRELAEAAHRNPSPKPPPGESGGLPTVAPGPPASGPVSNRIQISPARIQQHVQQAARFGWMPKNADQYAVLAELARMMSFARVAAQKPERFPNQPADKLRNMGQAADAAFREIQKVNWSAGHITAVNRFGAAQLERPGAGLFFIGRKRGLGNELLILSVEGHNQLAVVRATPPDRNSPNLERRLIIGVVTNKTATISNGNQSAKARVVESVYRARARD